MRKPGRPTGWIAAAALALAALALAAPALAAPASPPGASAIDAPVIPISLAEALAAIDAGNIDLTQARGAVAAAAAALSGADTAPNPQLSLGAVSIKPNRISQVGLDRLSDTSVRLDLPIERGGKRAARVGAARAGLAAADAGVFDARRQVRAVVAGAWVDLKAAEQRLALDRALAESYRVSQRLAERRLAAGAIAGGELARQQVEALRAGDAAAAAAVARRDAQLSLAVLIGREPDAPALATAGDWPSAAEEPATTGDPEAIADQRPDVVAANARVEQARRQLDGARALRSPDIIPGVQYEHDPQGLGSTVGFGLSIALPVRNRFRGEVEAAGAQLALAEAVAAKTRSVAIAEVMAARTIAAQAAARRRALDEAQLPAARRAARTAEFAYSSGALGLLDLLDARRTLQSIELAAIDARSDEARALARLTAAQTTGDTQ